MSQTPIELPVKQTSEKVGDRLPSRFPQTVVAVSREEFIEPLQLNVRDIEGNATTLPNDLQGHYFLVAPVGSPNSAKVDPDQEVVWVSRDGWTALYNGDGMVYRLSFGTGDATLKTRLMKPPCYYADLATAKGNNRDQYKGLGFANVGISRASLNSLGIRNQLNTSFVPFQLKDDETERLLVTWDVGRPYEIDPDTLETLTPVGTNQDWSDLLATSQALPFKNLMGSAHPVFDPHTEELFTVNIGKSFATMLAFSRSLKTRLADNKIAVESIVKNSILAKSLQRVFISLYSGLLGILNLVSFVATKLIPVINFLFGEYDFVHLLGWDGRQVEIKPGRKWNILLPGNRPLKIDQTVHQMGITKNYIVFVETSFKFSLENTLPFQQNSLVTSFKILLMDFFNYPQHPYTKLYIVKRADLTPVETASSQRFGGIFQKKSAKLPTVVAQEVELDPEFSHYTVDYEDTDGQIVLYASHLAGTDIAEYIRIYERSAYDDRDHDYLLDQDIFDDPELTARLHRLAGNITSPLDISRVGRWVIDGATGDIIDRQQFPDESDRQELNRQLAAHHADPQSNQIDPKYLLPWSTAFYVCPDHRPTKKYTDIFWNSWGCWPDTLTYRAIEAYENYPGRLVDLKNVVNLTYEGVPSCLFQLQIRTNAEGKTKIELNPDNYYQFSNRSLGTSAQFVPRPEAEDQTDGYIVCVVLTSDEFLSQSDRHDNDPEWSQNSEIWIFDARKLKQGPLYKLSHPKLNIGFSFHTTWMPEAKSPKRRLDYDVRADYEYLVQDVIANQPELADKIRQLFDQEVYPHF
jgi:carotenoid cleavage dioxygenase-like enzyme